jgi:RNase adapter protein RapZ
MKPDTRPLTLIVVTGMAGSGKSVALHALEDAGFYCVDNLPPELLLSFVDLEQQQRATRIAVAVDVRSVSSLPLMPQQLDALAKRGIDLRCVFLDSSTETLVHRFSETRRKHPLSGNEPDQHHALTKAIEIERSMLQDLRDRSHVLDTSLLRAAQLQSHIKALVEAPSSLTLVFQSFGFKHGVPLDADYVFDVRMLPNPYYERELRPLTGLDADVANYLAAKPDVAEMQADIERFISRWLPALARDHRSYVTVAIGCTGGQHRSVYLVERLAQTYSKEWSTLKRHREVVPGSLQSTRS